MEPTARKPRKLGGGGGLNQLLWWLRKLGGVASFPGFPLAFISPAVEKPGNEAGGGGGGRGSTVGPEESGSLGTRLRKARGSTSHVFVCSLNNQFQATFRIIMTIPSFVYVHV